MVQKMDPELLNTCKLGLVEKLKTLCDTHLHDDEFFLACQVSEKRNMLHVIIKERPSFIKEALEILPIQVVRQLICLPNSTGDNPLHQAASRNNEETNAKLLVDAYKRSSDVVVGDDLPSCPPWRAENNQRKVPAQIAISCNHDEVAAFLISVDDPDIFKFVDACKLLLQSIFKGCLQTVNLILTSNYEYSIEGFDPRRIKNECHNFDERYISLLQYHPEIANYLDHSGKKEVLARATNKGAVHVVKAILNIDISNSYSLLIGRGKYHLLGNAVSHDRLEIAHLILDAFNKSRERQAQMEMEAAVRANSVQPLWSLPHKPGETPLSVAFRNRHKKLAVDMLYSDFALLSDLVDICDERPKIIPATEQQGFKDFIEGQMNEDYDKNWIMDVYVKAILRFLRENSDDSKSRKLIRQLPNLRRFEDASGRKILEYLLDENDVDGMSLLLKIHPSIETPDGEHVQLFINAYRRGNLSAIRAICDLSPNCPQAAINHEDQNTILHKVRLPGLQEYRSLLDIPGIAQLKKRTDASGRQPLIKAIQDNNVHLAEALLKIDGIDAMDIKSTDGKTAAVLLKEKSTEHEWECLYKKYVKQATSYIQLDTDLKDMRNTLSVVAALLATITFAAAFTVPGGFDQKNGDVLLGQRASFIVFLLSDTYAMCCSIIVLCSLIWSMVMDSHEARLLIDRIVFVLLQSLYGTLVAFMTGVYTITYHKTLWVAIVVCVISSCVAIIANNRKILVAVLDKVVPTSRAKSSPPRPAESSIDRASRVETSMGPTMSAVSVQP